MVHCLRRVKSLVVSEEAVAATEYAVMLALIALTAIGSITSLGNKVDDIFATLTSQLPTDVGN